MLTFEDNNWKGEFDNYLNIANNQRETGGYSDITFINKLEDKESIRRRFS